MTKPRYYPTYVGQDSGTAQELERLSAILNDPTVEIPLLYVAPAKPLDGQVVRADGTSWDPAGTGVQTIVIYDEAAAEWLPLGTASGGGPGTGTDDHGSLQGLLDDDHPQYLTRTRGDALYYPLEYGEGLAGEITQIETDIDTLQEGVSDVIADIVALTPRVDSLETIQAQHTQDITDLETTFGDTAAAAASAAAAAASAVSAAQAAADALAAADDAVVAKDAAVVAQTAAETAEGNASSSASTASTHASNAATSASEAASSASAALTSEVNAASWANVAQDAAQGGVTVDAAPGCLWKFDADLQSWTGTNPTPTWDSGGYLLQGGGTDPTLQSPTIAVDGSIYSSIAFRIRRTSGSGWQGRFRYSTAGHGFSASYEKTISEPLFVTNEWMVVSVDMSTIADWEASTITGVQLELGSDSGTSAFELDWIAVGNDVAALATAAALSAQEAATYADDAQTYAGAAQSSATTASAQAANSASSASAAASSASQAGASATAAAASASAADVSKVAAQTARSGAESAQAAAVLAKQDAESAAAQASTYATNAANSATEAGNEALAAGTYATNAETYANNAQASANSASGSADQAASAAGSAGNSASAAALSAQSAQSFSTQAGASATASAGSATSAQTSASQASSFAGQASTSAQGAATSAVNASTSATTAGQAAATATSQASSASASASQASASAALAAAYRSQILPVNPLNVNGDTSRWANVSEVSSANVGSRLGYFGRVPSAADLAAYTEWLQVDPAAIYEVRISVLKSALKGRFYIGLQASTDGVNANANLQPVRNQVAVDAPTLNGYWVQTQVDAGYSANQWYDFVLYVVGAAISVAQCPDAYCNGSELTTFPWSQEYHGLQLASGAPWARLRLLNYDNAGTLTTLYATNVFVTRIDNQNTAALKVESTARASADGTLASQLTSLETEVDGNTASVAQLLSSVSGIEAKYAVKVDVNGRVAGIELIATGTTSAFAIYADKFSIAIPGSPGSAPKIPFVVGMVNGVSTVGIDGNLLVDGSVKAQAIYTAYLSAISADLGAINAGTITFTAPTWYIRAGKSGYSDTTAGFYLGRASYGSVQMNIGGASSYMKWDGGTLSILGKISAAQAPKAWGTFSVSGGVLTIGQRWPTNLSIVRQSTGVYRVTIGTIDSLDPDNNSYCVVLSGSKAISGTPYTVGDIMYTDLAPVLSYAKSAIVGYYFDIQAKVLRDAIDTIGSSGRWTDTTVTDYDQVSFVVYNMNSNNLTPPPGYL